MTERYKYWPFVIRHLGCAPFSIPMILWFALIFWFKSWGNWIGMGLYYLFGIPFVIASGVYNATVGWIVFLEPPRHLQFTDRMQAYDKDPTMAIYIDQYKRVLNSIDPGHV